MSTILRIVACVIVGSFTTSSEAQIVGLPPDPSIPTTEFTVGVSSLETGTAAELPILANPTGDPSIGVNEFGFIECTAGELSLVDIRPGASLQAFADAGNPVPTCDISVDPLNNTAFFVMFAPGFDVTVWGNEFLVLDVSVVGAADTTTTVTIDSLVQMATFDIAITAPAVEFRRGDSNADGDCSIADVIRTAEVLFRGRATDCPDAVDFNDSGSLELLDMIEMLDSMFGSGPAFVMQCESDAQTDTLGPCTGGSVCP